MSENNKSVLDRIEEKDGDLFAIQAERVRDIRTGEWATIKETSLPIRPSSEEIKALTAELKGADKSGDTGDLQERLILAKRKEAKAMIEANIAGMDKARDASIAKLTEETVEQKADMQALADSL